MDQAVIFDFGGVLVTWEPFNIFKHYFPNDPQAMHDFFNEIDFMKWNAEQDKGRSFAEGVRILSAQFPQYAEPIRAYHQRWEESIGAAIDGSVDILKELKSRNFRVFGLSNFSNETFPIVRKRYNFFELLDDFILSADVHMIKPDPAIFELALKQFNVKAENTIFIDDSMPNIESAKKMRMNVIHFTTPASLRAELVQREILD